MNDPIFPAEQSSSAPVTVRNTVHDNGDEDVDLVQLAITLLRAKRQIALWTLIATLVGLVVSLLLKPVFTAETVIMPPQQAQSSAASLIAGQLGALGGLAGGASSALGLKNPSDLFIGILKSKTIADNLVNQFHLLSVYHAKLQVDARKQLKSNTVAEASKDGLIHITVKDHDPVRAAGLANGYVDQLYQMNAKLAISEAAQRRLFFDQQLNAEKAALAAAEDDLKKTEEKTGVIQLTGQAEMTIASIANIQAEIQSREVELEVTRTFATDHNPEVLRLQQEIASLKSQLATLENSQQKMAPGDVQVPSGRVPAVGLEYLRKEREVRYHEALFELLAKQREAATLDEAKSAPLIQVVDRAEVPERKSGPPRLLITVGCGVLGFILGCAWILIRSALNNLEQDPEQAAQMHELKAALRLRQG